MGNLQSCVGRAGSISCPKEAPVSTAQHWLLSAAANVCTDGDTGACILPTILGLSRDTGKCIYRVQKEKVELSQLLLGCSMEQLPTGAWDRGSDPACLLGFCLKQTLLVFPFDPFGQLPGVVRLFLSRRLD